MAINIADRKNNNLPFWGNEKTMNLNNLILTNILSSHYFKVNLYGLKTYHEVIDEIYYKVKHLEPWEKGSRVTAGQTGMCGGVRGVGAGGIVSTSFCILYKLFTLKLTRKQVVGLINHADSPYIRALGFMYLRYTQPPADLWDWYVPYLDDDETIDVKAGGGKEMTIGNMLQHFLSKLEWFSTLFPRIPVPIQKQIEKNFSEWNIQNSMNMQQASKTYDSCEQSSTSNIDYEETDRERRHKHSRERYEKSKHDYSGHSSRQRSRSPSSSQSRKEKSYYSQHRDSSNHHSQEDRSSKNRNHSSDHHRHRDHSQEGRSSKNRNHSSDHHSHRHHSRKDRSSGNRSHSSDHHLDSHRHKDSYSHKRHHH